MDTNELETKATNLTNQFTTTVKTSDPFMTMQVEVHRLNLALLIEKESHAQTRSALIKQIERIEAKSAERIQRDLEAQAATSQEYAAVIDALKEQIKIYQQEIKQFNGTDN